MKLNDLFNENEIEIVEIIATDAKEKTIKDIKSSMQRLEYEINTFSNLLQRKNSFDAGAVVLTEMNHFCFVSIKALPRNTNEIHYYGYIDNNLKRITPVRLATNEERELYVLNRKIEGLFAPY